MNRFIKVLLLTAISPVYLFSQYTWTDVNYHFQTGTVPPPYYYSYELFINSGGSCSISYRPTYSTDSTWVYKFDLITDQLNTLNGAITNSGVLTDSITGLPENKHPIGGSLKNVVITLYQDPVLDRLPPVIRTPYFPIVDFKQKLEDLYESIVSLVPQSIWDGIKERKEKGKN
jgi:hypothetical protein